MINWCLPSRSLLMFTMENCFYVLISQAVRCLKDPSILPRDKQRLKQELSSELVRQHICSNPKLFKHFGFFAINTRTNNKCVFLCICEKCMNSIQLLLVCNHEAGIKLHLLQY